MKSKEATAVVRSTRFVREVRTEFKKVVWPTPRQTVFYTISVLFMTAVVAFIVYVADTVFKLGLGHL